MTHSALLRRPWTSLRLTFVLMACMCGIGHAQIKLPEPGIPAPAATAQDGGPVRLRQALRSTEQADPRAERAERDDQRLKPTPPAPGEFERFVQRVAGTEVRRVGAELVTANDDTLGAEAAVQVPPDYVIAPGDEVLLLLWGSVDADLRLVVDRAGRISVPRVGAIQVAGVRHAELAEAIDRRVRQVFKGYQMSATLGQLRSVRIFVTGFVVKPGAYTVSAMSSVVAALMRSGGPSAAGSFRQVELRRGGTLVARYDLYDLLLKGDRAADRLVQAGDVVHVGPVGTQAAVIGSVNRPVVVELLPGEGVSRALAMAGGLSAVAERTRLTIERLEERQGQRIAELRLPADANLPLAQGDIVRAFSATESMLSTQRQNKRVRIDGEVQRPGEYVLPPQSTLQDALRAAGGLAPNAFVYGAQFTRESVRATQQESYQRALRDLETDFARASSSQRVSSSDQAALTRTQEASAARLIERLRALQPSGRVVLQLTPQSPELPALVLEDEDRLYIPPRPTTVGVFGSVFNTGSYLYSDGRQIDDYVRLAGGPTKGADEESIFVVRANGQVFSSRQAGGGGWLRSGNRIGTVGAEPGDTVFVPEEMDKSTFVQSAKDWTQILYQFGIGIAGIVSASR